MDTNKLNIIKEKLEKEINRSPNLVLKQVRSNSFYIVSKKVFNLSSLNMHFFNIKGKIELKKGLPDVTYKEGNHNILTPAVVVTSIAL